ncbi:hypothetical protein QJS10_CPB13g01274 [Acorus calamus]|uniref:Uncharacterized protein n=1 Tax=Acorus calamus TaxID=4465 RepID=A0AAV9DHS3_ACOCL|nr:hypothetical protein QJS10_CPB13g01274 [Acorus calamus]
MRKSKENQGDVAKKGPKGVGASKTKKGVTTMEVARGDAMRGAAKDNKPEDHAAMEASAGLSKPMTDVGETMRPKTRGRLLSQQLQAKKPQEKRLLTKPNMPKTYKQAAKEKHVQLSEDEQVALACHLSKMESEELQPVYREVTDVLRQNYPGKQRCTPKEIALIDKFLENPLMDDSPAWEVPDDGSTVHTMVTRKHLFEVISNQWLGEEDQKLKKPKRSQEGYPIEALSQDGSKDVRETPTLD